MAIIAESQAELTWPQQHQVPLGGFYNVYHDGATGTVNYSQEINPLPIDAWPDGVAWSGFGAGAFGAGMFGFGDVGLPFGAGRFGMGMFGFGAQMHEFTTPGLADGSYKLAVVGFDPADNPASPAATIEQTVTLAGTPWPAKDLKADSYAAGTLTVSWTLSDDDETAG